MMKGKNLSVQEIAVDKYLLHERLISQIIGSMMKIVEVKDRYTSEHHKRVSSLASAIAAEMGLSEARVKAVTTAGILHDIGKINIPVEILTKPGRINETEIQILRGHVLVGCEILNEIEFPWPVAQIVMQHHERINGSGYPYALYGEEILAEAKIVGIADVVEAITSHRPYRSALGLEYALGEIWEKRGVLYGEDEVEACLRLFSTRNYKFPGGNTF